MTPSLPLDPDTVKRFTEIGVHRLIPSPRRPSDRQLFPQTLSEGDVLEFVKRTADLAGRD